MAYVWEVVTDKQAHAKQQRFEKVILGAGTGITENDWNEAWHIIHDKVRTMERYGMGFGVPIALSTKIYLELSGVDFKFRVKVTENGYVLCGKPTALTSGRCLWLYEDLVTTAAIDPTGTFYIYLAVRHSEDSAYWVSGDSGNPNYDPEISVPNPDTSPSGVETTRRVRTTVELIVSTDAALPDTGVFEYYKLAKIIDRMVIETYLQTFKPLAEHENDPEAHGNIGAKTRVLTQHGLPRTSYGVGNHVLAAAAWNGAYYYLCSTPQSNQYVFLERSAPRLWDANNWEAPLTNLPCAANLTFEDNEVGSMWVDDSGIYAVWIDEDPIGTIRFGSWTHGGVPTCGPTGIPIMSAATNRNHQAPKIVRGVHDGDFTVLAYQVDSTGSPHHGLVTVTFGYNHNMAPTWLDGTPGEPRRLPVVRATYLHQTVDEGTALAIIYANGRDERICSMMYRPAEQGTPEEYDMTLRSCRLYYDGDSWETSDPANHGLFQTFSLHGFPIAVTSGGDILYGYLTTVYDTARSALRYSLRLSKIRGNSEIASMEFPIDGWWFLSPIEMAYCQETGEIFIFTTGCQDYAQGLTTKMDMMLFFTTDGLNGSYSSRILPRFTQENWDMERNDYAYKLAFDPSWDIGFLVWETDSNVFYQAFRATLDTTPSTLVDALQKGGFLQNLLWGVPGPFDALPV